MLSNSRREELARGISPRSDASHADSREQEQGLLKEWKRQAIDDDETEDGDAGEELAQTHRTLASRIGVYVGVAVAAILVLVAGSLYYFSNVTTQEVSAVEAALRVQSNDYILDTNWAYDEPPKERHYTWIVQDHIHNADGIYRPMMLVNNQFPGPLIEVNEGDTIVVRVENRATNATSFHWHGIYQNGTAYMDGTVGITQCAIAPGASFAYNFTVSGQSGTYWWHAHQGVQSSDGLHGPLIIHGRDERQLQEIKYDTDRVLLVSDHYHELSSALLWQYLKPDMENAEPVPQSGLLNGRNTRNCERFPERQCDNTTSNVGVPMIDLAPNQNHRLRLINVGAFAEFQIQIDEHELAVTEVDGTDVSPVPYHRININPAQRYSVIVNTTRTAKEQFWFRARMVTKCFTDAPSTLQPDLRAIVRSSESTIKHDQLPESIDWTEQLALQCRDMDTTELRPSEAIVAPSKPDAFYFLRANFEIGDARLSRGVFNSSSWRPDARSPSLLRAIDGLSTANTSYDNPDEGKRSFVNSAAFDPARELVIQSSEIEVIDLLIHNFDDGNHPIHLHGYKYFVLAQGHGYPPLTHVGATMMLEHLAPLYDSLDLSNPLRRDTASVEAYGWILIRVIADNPGAWALHCHISWHSEAGLMMQMLTRTDELKNMHIPQANLDLCSAPGVELGMGPDDADYWDLA